MEFSPLLRSYGWKTYYHCTPAGCGFNYYNYKGRHSMVLLAIADANYQFIMCDFGTNGRISDGGVLKNTIFYERLEKIY